MDYLKVIVLILSYNGKHLLDDSISSYLENDYPNFKVVVIDNGSSDSTKEYIEKNFPEARVIRLEKNRGYSGGFNFGLDYAFNKNNADYVLVTNNDVRADKRVISELVKVAETDKRIGFVTGKVYYNDGLNVLQTVGKKWHSILWSGPHIGANEKDVGQYEKIEERVFLDDIFTLVPRELYKQTGGYDSQLYLQAEEFDWQIQAKKLGWKLYYTPYAKIWHKGSATIGGLGSPISMFFYIRNHMIVIFKHGNVVQSIRIWFYFLGKNLFALIKSFLKITLRRKSRLVSHLAGLLGWMSATAWIIHRKPTRKIPWFIKILK